MPQPLSRVAPKARYSITHESALKRPTLAAQAASCIGAWAHIEYEMSLVAMHVLGADSKPILAAYSALDAASAQKAALFAAADAAFEKHQHLLVALKATYKEFECRGRDRHKLAHWLWGHTDDLPDAILMANPDYFFDWNYQYRDAQKQAFLEMLRTGTKSLMPASALPDTSQIFVYRQSDFDGILRDMVACIRYVGNLHSCVRRRAGKGDAQYVQLCSEPPIRQNIPAPSQKDAKRPPTQSPQQ